MNSASKKQDYRNQRPWQQGIRRQHDSDYDYEHNLTIEWLEYRRHKGWQQELGSHSQGQENAPQEYHDRRRESMPQEYRRHNNNHNNQWQEWEERQSRDDANRADWEILMDKYYRYGYKDGRVKCFKCKKVGHVARNCKKITNKELLYDVDRVHSGIKFKLFKYTKVNVTCPERMCRRCLDAKRKAEKSGLAFKTPSCSCSQPEPKTKPVDEFKELNLDRQFLDNIVSKTCCNFEAPTPIQRFALPIITRGFDVMGCAQTGTGKTAAYIIPMVKFIKDGGYEKNPVDWNTPQQPEVLIVAPTRELVAQIEVTARKLTNGIDPAHMHGFREIRRRRNTRRVQHSDRYYG